MRVCSFSLTAPPPPRWSPAGLGELCAAQPAGCARPAGRHPARLPRVPAVSRPSASVGLQAVGSGAALADVALTPSSGLDSWAQRDPQPVDGRRLWKVTVTDGCPWRNSPTTRHAPPTHHPPHPAALTPTMPTTTWRRRARSPRRWRRRTRRSEHLLLAGRAKAGDWGGSRDALGCGRSVAVAGAWQQARTSPFLP